MRRRNNELSFDELKTVKADLPVSSFSLPELIEAFIDDCELRNLRAHTVKFYRNELRSFANLIQTENIEEITSDLIKDNVIRTLKEQGNKPVSINTRLRAVRAFYNFLHAERYIKANPMENVSMLRHRKNIIETLSVTQINALLNACDLKTFVGYRDYVIISCLLETGVRANELVNIDVYDVDLSRGIIRIKHSKNHLERSVPIQKEMKDLLNRYIGIRGKVATDRLFITLDGLPLSKRQLQNRISRYGKLANIHGVRVSPHTLRHTFAKLCVINGANAFQLQAILGHTTLEMTKTYVNLFGNEVAEGHKKFSPLQNIRRK